MLCNAVVCDCIQTNQASRKKSLEQQQNAGFWGVKNSYVVCEGTDTRLVAACGQVRNLSCQNKCKSKSKRHLPDAIGGRWTNKPLRYPLRRRRALSPQVGNRGEKLGECKVGHKQPICACEYVQSTGTKNRACSENRPRQGNPRGNPCRQKEQMLQPWRQPGDKARVIMEGGETRKCQCGVAPTSRSHDAVATAGRSRSRKPIQPSVTESTLRTGGGKWVVPNVGVPRASSQCVMKLTYAATPVKRPVSALSRKERNRPTPIERSRNVRTGGVRASLPACSVRTGARVHKPRAMTVRRTQISQGKVGKSERSPTDHMMRASVMASRTPTRSAPSVRKELARVVMPPARRNRGGPTAQALPCTRSANHSIVNMCVLILHLLLACSTKRFSGITMGRGSYGKWEPYETPRTRGSSRIPGTIASSGEEAVGEGGYDSVRSHPGSSATDGESYDNEEPAPVRRREAWNKGEKVLAALEWPSKADGHDRHERFTAYVEAWKETERHFQTRQRGQRAVHFALMALRKAGKRLVPKVIRRLTQIRVEPPGFERDDARNRYDPRVPAR